IVVIFVFAAEMIDEVNGFRVAAEQPGDDLAGADEERRGAVTGGQLKRACGQGFAFFRCREQDRAAAALRDLQGNGESRAAGALRGGEVERLQIAAKRERVGDNAGVLTVDEGESG